MSAAPDQATAGSAAGGERVPVRDDLGGARAYGAPQLDVSVRLNTNETPWPPPAEFTEALGAAVSELALHRYPDRTAWGLRAALGERLGVPPEGVWPANGSNEVLAQLLQAYGGPGRTLLRTQPGFAALPIIARTTGTDTVAVDLDDALRLTPERAAEAVERHDPDVVCVANPNNPTGVFEPLEVVRALHDAARALVIVDEAYAEFADASAVELVGQLPRLVVTRTFSKAFRLAGLRLGYLLGPEWVVDDLALVRLPYHLDAITQAAGELACAHAETVTAHIDALVAERERVRAALGARGVTTWPSQANFVLVREPLPNLFQALLDRDVLVRDVADQPRLAGCVRVTIGTPEENDAFLAALDDAIAAHRAEQG